MMAPTSSSPPGYGVGRPATGVGWYRPLARLLGRSSRWATDEADNLVKVAREMMVATTSAPRAPKQKLRAGSPVPVLVEELSELVARSDCRELERDPRFWCLVRELYSRRPWSPRRPRPLVETVGIEVKEPSASRKGRGETVATSDSSERAAT